MIPADLLGDRLSDQCGSDQLRLPFVPAADPADGGLVFRLFQFSLPKVNGWYIATKQHLPAPQQVDRFDIRPDGIAGGPVAVEGTVVSKVEHPSPLAENRQIVLQTLLIITNIRISAFYWINTHDLLTDDPGHNLSPCYT
jgi:hypothetical protein